MKILLVNPNRTYYPGSKGIRVGLPLGLMYMAGILEKNSYQPKILDCLIHLETKIRQENNITVHGLSNEIIKKEIKDYQPDIVGISSPFTAQIDNAIAVADLVKAISGKIITVIGGPHVAVAGAKLLRENKSIDFGVAGEGEYAFLNFLSLVFSPPFQGRVRGGCRNQKAKGVEARIISSEYIQNLDQLPLPAYHLIDLDLFFQMQKQGLGARPLKQKRSISMITSRGCPFNCVFCSIHLHMGKRWRYHSSVYILNHIEYVVKKYGIRHISFEDDNMTADINRAKKIFQGLIDRKIKITWDTPNGVRADRMDEELAQLMKKSGCVELIFGVESGDQDILNKVIDKSLKLEEVEKSAVICKKIGIKTKAFFVIGFPGEKIANMKKSMEFALRLRQKYGTRSDFLIAAPLIGTKLYKICQEKRYLTAELTPRNLAIATQSYGRGLIKTPDFTPEQLKDLANGLERKMAKIDFKEKLKNPVAYWQGLKFVFTHPKKTIKYLREKIFS